MKVLKLQLTSGGFGITADVKNTDVENITDLKWSITVDGNIVFLGGYKEGNIPIIRPGETYTIKSGLVLGFGSADITINVAGVTKKASCFLFGPFVLSISD